jgi:hypothetical protein
VHQDEWGVTTMASIKRKSKPKAAKPVLAWVGVTALGEFVWLGTKTGFRPLAVFRTRDEAREWSAKTGFRIERVEVRK